jgi:hypothetical protein
MKVYDIRKRRRKVNMRKQNSGIWGKKGIKEKKKNKKI